MVSRTGDDGSAGNAMWNALLRTLSSLFGRTDDFGARLSAHYGLN